MVNWGDGSAPQTLTAANLTPIGTPNGVSWNVNAAHTYAEEGTYAYTVTVTDDGGASTTITGSAVIADADAHRRSGDSRRPRPNTGVPFTTVVGTFTDANTWRHTDRLHGRHRLGRRVAELARHRLATGAAGALST